jgi:hypothetical protein
MFSHLLLLSNHQKYCRNLNSTLISLIAEEEEINENGGFISKFTTKNKPGEGKNQRNQ